MGPIVVGMSGGVDSSVAALLLKEQGFQVEGIFIKSWEEEGPCPAEEDYNDALGVCDQLDIPLHSVNFTKEYQERVFSYFLREYAAGRTPNPDILCNNEIKFDAFLKYALNLGATHIATGHYARVENRKGVYHLYQGSDKQKDQSYFLSGLGQTELSHAFFPLGERTKGEVRQLAREAGLVTHDKKDSTGICFIGERNFRAFLKQYLPTEPGIIETVDGEVVGKHEGLMYYTIGQRKGLGIGGKSGKEEAPWYVVDKDLQRKVLIVAQGHDHPRLYSKRLTASQVHWIAEAPQQGDRLQAKVRYRQENKNCVIEVLTDEHAVVQFEQPVFAVAPGQAIVFYNDEECLGGGIIDARE